MEKLGFFQNLGFSEYESKVILSLLRLNNASPKEISFDCSVPQNKLELLVSGLRRTEDRKQGYTHPGLEMRPDFPQPDFYKKLFELWGLDQP